MFSCKAKCQEGVSRHLGGVLTSLKRYCAIWGIAAIVRQYTKSMGTEAHAKSFLSRILDVIVSVPK